MIYELDGHRPDLPEEGRYWIAPNATLTVSYTHLMPTMCASMVSWPTFSARMMKPPL